MDELITPLDQEIAKLFIATSDKQAIIDGLIRMLRGKQEVIDQYEQWFAGLNSETFWKLINEYRLRKNSETPLGTDNEPTPSRDR